MTSNPPTDPSDEGDGSFRFELSLPFAVPECSKCGCPVTGKVCQCGTTAPEIGLDPHAESRRSALGTASGRAKDLLDKFDQLPQGVIPVSPDQFVFALRESDLVTKIGDSYKLGAALGDLDLCDPKVVGSDARRVIEAHLDQVEVLFKACEELAEFEPQSPADELRDLAREAGKYGAELAAVLIGALTASTYSEAAIERDKAEKLWAGFPLGDHLSACLKKLEPWSEPDLNARVELALGREGQYTDDAGALDPGLVFLAFAKDDDPYESLAREAWRYVAPHTNLTKEFHPAFSAVLISPLVMLAASERPLRSHRTTRLMFKAAMAAHEADSAATATLADRATNEAPSIFAALSRVQRAFSDLTQDLADEDALDRMLRSYRQLAETAYRTMGWLALGFESIARGDGLPTEMQPPMLGPLQQRLAAGGALAKTLASGIDVELRNAEAHAQYRWVVEREVVRDFRTGQEWSVEDLENAMHEIAGSITGGDAGYACFIAANELGEKIPASLSSGEIPEVPQVLAGLTFGARGFEVERVTNGGATIVVRSLPQIDTASLLPAVAGLVPFVPKATVFRVEDTEGLLLVEVGAETIRQSVDGPPLFKDLAVMAVVYENAVRTGMDPDLAGEEFVALIQKVVAVTGMQDLVDRELAPSAFRNLNDRLGYAATLIKAPLGLSIPEPAKHAKRLGRIRSTVVQASRGNQRALESLMNHLGSLAREADDSGATWPPRISH